MHQLITSHMDDGGTRQSKRRRGGEAEDGGEDASGGQELSLSIDETNK